MLWETAPFFRSAAPAAAFSLSAAFHTLAWLGYSALYVAIALLPALIAARLLRSRAVYQTLAVIGSVIALLTVRADRSVFDLYNFHLNGFVLNLLLTPGGIESLGGGTDSYIAVALLVVRIIALQCALLPASRFVAPAIAGKQRWLIAALAALLLSAELLYGIGDFRNDGAVLDTADNYPLFTRVRFRGIAMHFGFAPASRAQNGAAAKIDTTRLQYPLHSLHYDAPTRPLNIVWLVAESLRWDQLAPDIMPNSWEFAQRSQHFLNHYSSGNGTREGLFGMFYGLYGSYWDNFLHAGRGPLLIERLQALNYQMELRTSARFSYPEFDKTLFAHVPRELLHEEEFKEDAWQRDRDNTSALLNFIDKRDPARPFLTFLFFESTHARYTFPDEAVVRKPYLEKIDYTDMSREKLAHYADQLRNRYSNSAHWVDMQMGRIYDYLQQQNLLENTVVIVTGDHGEEFMEKGFWGHNSSFVEEQTHTPMIVWMPGETPRAIEHTTSHMDIAVTLMQLLGASNDIGDYALGRNLFDTQARDFIVISDWHSIAIKTADFKYRIPYTSRGLENYRPTRSDDSAYPDRDAERDAIEQHQKSILEAVRNLALFAK
jgi:hypothetical protein